MMTIEAVFNLFTLLFVLFTIPVFIIFLIKQHIIVKIIRRLIIILALTTVFLFLQFLQIISKSSLFFFKFKFLPAVWILPVYISFLSQVSIRKRPKIIKLVFFIIPLLFTVFLFLGKFDINYKNGIFYFGNFFKAFLIFILFVINSGVIALGIEIFIFKSKREFSNIIFISLIIVSIGISVDLIFLLLKMHITNFAFPSSLMILYLLISYKLTIKFISFYDSISKNINLEKEFIEALDSNSNNTDYDLDNKEDIAVLQSKVKLAGGDFYHYCEISEDEDIFIIGDIETSGIKAAFFETMSMSYLDVFLHRKQNPGDILKNVNYFIITKHKNKPEFSMFICYRNKNKNEITIASAGHHAQILFNIRMNKAWPLKSAGIKIGVNKNSEYPERNVKYSEGDILVLFSDGLMKAVNYKQENFGIEEIESILIKKASQAPKRIAESIINYFKSFDINNKIKDDVLLMVIKL